MILYAIGNPAREPTPAGDEHRTWLNVSTFSFISRGKAVHTLIAET